MNRGNDPDGYRWADVEREHAYDLSVKLENQLGAMLDQLKDLVVKLNVQHDSALGEEPARDIMKIVNAHHQSLAYLNAKAQKMDADVSALEADVEQLRRQAPP